MFGTWCFLPTVCFLMWSAEKSSEARRGKTPERVGAFNWRQHAASQKHIQRAIVHCSGRMISWARYMPSCQGERQRHAGTRLPFTEGETEAERNWLFPHATLPEGGRDRFLVQMSGTGHNHEITFCISSEFHHLSVGVWGAGPTPVWLRECWILPQSNTPDHILWFRIRPNLLRFSTPS